MNRKQMLKLEYGSRLVTLFLILSLTLTSVSSGIAAPPPPDNKLIELSQATQGDLRISYHHETGQVRFLGVHPGTPIAQPKRLATGATAEEAARAFLDAYGSPFGLKDQAQELAVMRDQVRDEGRTFVRFQQTYHGIPVVGGELIVQVNAQRDVISVNGEILPDLALDVTPTISAESARQIALDKVAKDYDLSVGELHASTPELWIYNPILLGGPGPRFDTQVWRIEVSPLELAPIEELVLVDARLGAISLNFNQIDTARNRQTYDANNDTILPGTLVCNESNPTCSVGDVHEAAAHIYAGDTYDFYFSEHGRDSIDGAGMTLISTVHYDSDYDNAFWDGEQMVYGDAYGFPLADDVVAHELTHGVTDYESQLFYFYQSGAINESLSDVWGEFVDQEQATGNDAGDTRWEMGEDVTDLGAGRNMQDPTVFSDPDRIGSSYYYCAQSTLGGDGDNGGVHTNSGVNNKAAYLMTDGGSFNGYTVTGLGYAKVADLYYEVQTNLLTSAADYADLYDALIQACTNLGYSTADCQAVQDAVNATEMNQQPANCPANEAPVCDSGSPSDLFFDDVESGSGNWTSGSDFGTIYWFVPQTTSSIGFADSYATSGVGNIWGFSQGYPLGATSDTYLAMNSDVALPSNAYLHFNHSFGFESNSAGTVFYDGGVLEYSTTGGSSWTDAGSLISDNNYNGTISSDYGNPLSDRSAFTADSRGYISSRANLSSLAGQNVRFRFRIGTDSEYYDYGWFIDDVRVYTCESTNTAPSISGLPDQMIPMNGSADNAIDLWAYAADAENVDADLTFTINNTPAADVSVTIDTNRYIDISATTDWTGQTDVIIRVTDSGGLYATDTFNINVFEGKIWDGSASTDWHTADNWTPSGVPTSGDDVVIPDVSNDPVISGADAAVDSLTIETGAVLDLGDRVLTVEGTLSNDGTLKQTMDVSEGSTSNFLRITNLAGDQTKYYGLDITPSSAAFGAFDTDRVVESFAAQSLKSSDLPMPAVPLADVELILDDGTQENDLVLRDQGTQTEYHAVLFNHFTATMASGFPFTLERIDIHEDTNNLLGEEIQLLVYTDADGGDPSNAILRYNEIVTVQTQLGWTVYTLTSPVYISSSVDILLGFSTYYADGGVPWPFEDRYPYPMDETDPQGMSYAAWMDDTGDPVNPSDLSSFANLSEMGDIGYPCNWMIRGYGSLDTINTAPSVSGLPNQTVPVNGSADDAIDLWAYASDAEDTDDVMTYTISNSPIVSAGVSIDSNRYIDVTPSTDWTGVTDVVVQVQDTSGLTDTDTFQVTVSDDPDIDISPTFLEETLVVDETFTTTLTISNMGTTSLSFSFDTVAVSWLSVNPSSGEVTGGGAQAVDAVFDATGQSLGDYNTNLVVNNNDPDENPVTVPVTMHVSTTSNTPPAISGLPDQQVTMNDSLHSAIDLWAYTTDAEDTDDVITYTVNNSPVISAGVSISANRYIDIDPATSWTGFTDVEIQVQDTGGLTDTDTFQVIITGTGIITSVTVSVSGNQFCAGRSTDVARCFDITPAAALDATVRFYLTEAERNGLTLAELLVFHYDGDWIEEPGPYTSGGTGDEQYIQTQNIDDFSFFALGEEPSSGGTIYLPIIMKRYPPVPYTPVLNAISNSGNDGDYTVDWEPADLADTYTLEEDDNSSFSSPTTQHTGSGTSWSASDHAVGTYYYRVKATNSWGDSSWSNVQSTQVSPPTKVYPSADTVVIQGAPSSSYGSSSSMLAGYAPSGCLGWNGQVTRSLIKFDLTVIPPGTSITNATLYLNLVAACYYTGHTQARTVTLYRNANDWSTTTTWNSRPSHAEASSSASVAVTSFGWKPFDVTGIVQQWVNGSHANYGFTVRAPETLGNELAMLEFATLNASGTSYDPYLQITYTGMADSEGNAPESEGFLTLDTYKSTFGGLFGISPGTTNCAQSESVGLRMCTLSER
ncbi:MAG: DNRLRE domain-containing protein [Chloroflexi bacterium]|nr:DNRLRE domain-containing protein [Chloroflexota bacterium]